MEEDQIVLDVELSHLSESMLREVDTLWGKPDEIEDVTIFPVPYDFRQAKKNHFDPSGVSIGPFHHGKESVRAVEEQKRLFLRDFLSRGNGITLDRCLSEIKLLEERARRCYSKRVALDSNDFVKMMLLDGCFVLEYFLKGRSNFFGHSINLVSDLLLIENQILFFIVEKLCELISITPDDRRDFTNDLVKFFALVGLVNDTIVSNPPAEIHHLVHLCYHSIIPINLSKPVVLSSESFFPSMLSRIKNFVLDFPLWVLTRIFPKRNSLNSSLSFPDPFLIPCATELQNAGIKLRPKSNPDHMLDISFIDYVLEIPRLTFTEISKTILANLIAFEQYRLDKLGANLSGFALFLDSLVKSQEDVMILQHCGIFDNYLDSEGELGIFFRKIYPGMAVLDNHFLADLFTAVNRYCESSSGRRRAR